MKKKAKNCHIDPVLYNAYLILKRTMGAEMVHRRARKSNKCIEIVFYNELIEDFHDRINSLRDAEACGFWIICRRQRKRGHEIWHGRVVYQLFLSPVHPKKRREKLLTAQIAAEEVTFEPIAQKNTEKCARTCIYEKKAVNLQRILCKNYFYGQANATVCGRFHGGPHQEKPR